MLIFIFYRRYIAVQSKNDTLPSTMADSKQAPATKEDVAMLMNEIGKLYDANQRWKDEILEANEKWKEEVKNHFDVVAENIKHDLLKGALNDKIEQHEDRIIRLEKHAGLIRV